MSSLVLFIVSILVVAVISMLVFIGGPKQIKTYFSTDQGKGVLKGIIIFMLFGAVPAFLAFKANADDYGKGEWFEYGEVYVGLDYTKGISPQCYTDGPDNRVTSNGGIRVNIYQSFDRRFEFNSKYTHHSCAFNSDKDNYDALGIEITYKLW